MLQKNRLRKIDSSLAKLGSMDQLERGFDVDDEDDDNNGVSDVFELECVRVTVLSVFVCILGGQNRFFIRVSRKLIG